MSDLTVISDGMFTSPGLVRTDELPVMDADIVELEHKVSLLLQSFNNKLYQQTSWPWAGVEVPYAQNPGLGLPWGADAIPGLLQYGEPTGPITDADHLLAATPDAVRQVQAYFGDGLTARRLVQGQDLRKDIWIYGNDVGGATGEEIIRLAQSHRFAKELPGSDYAYVLHKATIDPTAANDDTLPLTRITAISPTSVTAEYKAFKVLVDGEWKVQ